MHFYTSFAPLYFSMCFCLHMFCINFDMYYFGTMCALACLVCVRTLIVNLYNCAGIYSLLFHTCTTNQFMNPIYNTSALCFCMCSCFHYFGYSLTCIIVYFGVVCTGYMVCLFCAHTTSENIGGTDWELSNCKIIHAPVFPLQTDQNKICVLLTIYTTN